MEAVAKSNVCATRWPAREKVIFSITKFFKSFRRILVCKVPLRRTFATLLSCVILERKSNDIVRNSNETSLFWGYGLLVMLWLVRLKLPLLRTLKNSTCQTEKMLLKSEVNPLHIVVIMFVQHRGFFSGNTAGHDSGQRENYVVHRKLTSNSTTVPRIYPSIYIYIYMK